MKRMRSMAVVLMATLGITMATTTPAWATFEVNLFDCTFGTADFLVFGQTAANGLGTRRCYADAGDLSLGLDRVTSFKSGNNAGYFEYEPGDGYRYRHHFPKGEHLTKWYGYVAHLHIN
ncbi:hypothetical protein JOM49_005075 [Amycolatopsis magusensis]|uniref:Streptomyces killer toxin-like beta/gamma crystallin domain-containing protein n=2 Tax=Amycolatopsis magusensis TaxID=882444 RepID=A0ABS4PXJ0_9PSEU|nr:hypothetical protein [Amycolatopsis magusensis]